jgi:hypothetical protein
MKLSFTINQDEFDCAEESSKLYWRKKGALMALIVFLSIIGLLALIGIVAALVVTATDGYGPVANRAYFRRLP